MLISDKLGFRITLNDGLDEGPKKLDPGEQEAEVIADGGEQGVGGVAGAAFKVIAVHSVT